MCGTLMEFKEGTVLLFHSYVALTFTHCILGIMENWVFVAKKFTQKPASQHYPGTLAVLVRYNQCWE